MLSLNDKKVLITGSTDGLGLLTAKELARNGAQIILHGRSEEKLNHALEEIKKINDNAHSIILCDFSFPHDIEKAFSGIEALDILINNTGFWHEGDTLDIKVEKIIEMVNVNVTSYLAVSRLMLPKLLESDFAQILNVVSVAGIEIPKDYFHTTYTATKFALQGYSEAMEKEFTDKNLRVMGFYPGGMCTNIFTKAGLKYKKNEDWMFDPHESVEAMLFMLTRNKKVNIKRLDLINHLFFQGPTL